MSATPHPLNFAEVLEMEFQTICPSMKTLKYENKSLIKEMHSSMA
jgi:hypothetical protein